MRLYFLFVVVFWTWQGSVAEPGSPPELNLQLNGTLSSDNHNNVSETVEENTRGSNAVPEAQKLEVREVSPKTLQVISVQDPLNILENLVQLNKTLKPTNTITSQDFVHATSLANNNNENSNSSSSSTNDGNDKKGVELSFVIESTIATPNLSFNVTEETKNPANLTIQVSNENQKNKTDDNTVLDVVNITSVLVNITNNITDVLSLSDVENLVDSEEHSAGNRTVKGMYKFGFAKVSNQMAEEIKVYSNEALLSWEEIKEKVAGDNEAANVLRDYNDKITISRAANNTECVKNDQQKYETRTNILKDILSSCEKDIKREEWYELQNRTKEALNIISETNLKAQLSFEKLTNEEKENERRVATIEKEVNEKLNKIHIDTIKQTLSELKNKALKTDEEDYTKCIEKMAANEIIVDTLKDIMRIKNNCVG